MIQIRSLWMGSRVLGRHQSKLEVRHLEIVETLAPKAKLVFGHYFTDHMFYAEWTEKDGWVKSGIRPLENISLAPSATVFHYGVSCFEGLKAYLDERGETRLFRPEMNMARMLCSVKRLALPQFDPKEMLEILKLYVDMERDWIPKGHGYSLYLRPSMIGAQEWLGVGPSNRAIFFIIACPVGPYYKASGFHPVSLWAEDRYVRAWPGGTGCYKLGSNYSPGILPQVEVARKGYTQVLWLFGPEHDLTEVGTMNLFVLWRRHSDNAVELITPSLDDGTILPGITRDSILQLTRHWREVEVTEGRITMAQIQQALRDNRLIEMFGSGTAAVISPVDKIHYRGQDLKIPCLSGKRDSLSQRLWRELTDIQCGRKQFQDWSMVVPRRL